MWIIIYTTLFAMVGGLIGGLITMKLAEDYGTIRVWFWIACGLGGGSYLLFMYLVHRAASRPYIPPSSKKTDDFN